MTAAGHTKNVNIKSHGKLNKYISESVSPGVYTKVYIDSAVWILT